MRSYGNVITESQSNYPIIRLILSPFERTLRELSTQTFIQFDPVFHCPYQNVFPKATIPFGNLTPVIAACPLFSDYIITELVYYKGQNVHSLMANVRVHSFTYGVVISIGHV